MFDAELNVTADEWRSFLLATAPTALDLSLRDRDRCINGFEIASERFRVDSMTDGPSDTDRNEAQLKASDPKLGRFSFQKRRGAATLDWFTKVPLAPGWIWRLQVLEIVINIYLGAIFVFKLPESNARPPSSYVA